MREIKFRGLAKVRDKKYATQMVYGQLDLKPGNDARIIWYGKNRNGKDVRRSVFIDYRTIGQLTGLVDSHDSELYEGDICWNPHDETWGEVVWDEGCWCYKWDNIVENLHDCSHTLDVRGNIHENSDLLE